MKLPISIEIKQAKCANSNPPTPTHMGSFKGNQPFVKFSVAVRMTEHHESQQSQSENFTTPLKGQLISKCLFEKIVWTKIPTKNLIDSAQQRLLPQG